MAGPSIGTWVKVRSKSGGTTPRVLAKKYGGYAYEQGQVITQSEYESYKKDRAERRDLISSRRKERAELDKARDARLGKTPAQPKKEVLGVQGDLFGGGQTIIANRIRQEEQRGKNGKGLTPTVKAAIAKSVLAQVPDIVEQVRNAPKGRVGGKVMFDWQPVPGRNGIKISIPGATTYEIENTPQALSSFLKRVGIKPNQLGTLAKKV